MQRLACAKCLNDNQDGENCGVSVNSGKGNRNGKKAIGHAHGQRVYKVVKDSRAYKALVLAPRPKITMQNCCDRAVAGLIPAAANELRFGEVRYGSRGAGVLCTPTTLLYFGHAHGHEDGSGNGFG